VTSQHILAGGYQQPPGYNGYPAAGAAHGTHQIVYKNGKPKKKKILGVNQNTATGMSLSIMFHILNVAISSTSVAMTMNLLD